jgi:hypothetical protein
MRHFPEVLCLVFVQLHSFSIKTVFDSILLELIINVESMKVFQRFGRPAQEVVYLKLTTKLGKALEVPQERKILPWIL